MKLVMHLIAQFLAALLVLVVSARMGFGQGASIGKGDEQMNKQVPVATQWVLDAAGETQRAAIKSVMMLVCPSSAKKGSAFLLKRNFVLTNAHVVEGCSAETLIGFSSDGAEVRFTKMITDPVRDLALLRPSTTIEGGLELSHSDNVSVGIVVSTWGFPLGYNGPAPLLSVGYLSGFKEDREHGRAVKHLVVNGAFNPGNSGGPLFEAQSDRVIGVVVSKHAPLTPFVSSAIQALANNQSGVMFQGRDDRGMPIQFVESQIVAQILEYYRNLTQVMIGEAISLSELRAFLNEREKELQ